MNLELKAKIATTFDAALVLITIVCLIWMRFSSMMPPNGYGEYFKYYTVLSNVLLGVAATVSLPFDLLVALGKRQENPRFAKIFFLTLATATTITMLTVIFFLGPTMGFAIMYLEFNAFMHLITPLLGLGRVLFFEVNAKELNWKHSLFGVLTTVIYGSIYVINCATHNGYGSVQYDWYGFGAGGLGIGILAYFIMVILTYGVAFLLYFGQKKINQKLEC